MSSLTRVVFVVAVVTLVTTAAGPRASAQAPSRSTTSAAASAPQGTAISVEGVVVYIDAANGLFVHVDGQTFLVTAADKAGLQVGDKVIVTGTAVTREGQRSIIAAAVTRRGSAALPLARRVTAASLTTDPDFDDWVEFDAVLQSVANTANGSDIFVVIEGQQVPVTALGNTPEPDTLVDAEVHIRGLRRLTRNQQGVVTAVAMLSPGLADSDILTPPPATPSDLPVVPVSEAQQRARRGQTQHRIRIRGTVLVRHPSFKLDRRVVHVQDATGALPVEVGLDVDTKIGDQLDIVGFPVQFFTSPILQSATIRRLSRGAAPAPYMATTRELLAGRYPNILVRVRGTFVEYTRAQSWWTLVIESDGIQFNTFLYDWPAHGPLPELKKGSVIDVTGVSGVYYSDNADGNQPRLVVTLSTPADIVLIQAPSWWTARNLTIATASAAGFGILALAWVAVLNARVHKQSRSLEEQFERTAALQQRWANLVATASDVIVTWDLHGHIRSMNKTGETLTGMTEESAQRLTLKDLAAPQSVAVAEALSSAHAVTRGQMCELEILGADGRAVPLEINVQPMFDNREHVGFQGIGRNVSAHKQAERALREARDAAEEANRAKSDFLANMSHEIRTPMNGIIGMTDLALTTELTPVQQEYLETVKTSADSLLGILNSILDFSKIESGKLEIESVPFALRDVVTEAVKPLSVKADQRGLELLLDVAGNVPDGLIGDPLRLRQVLTNLVSNALKFTERGHVLVQIREHRRAAGCVSLHFSVTDTGIGIPEDKLAMVFEPFSQADGSTTRRYGGTGLGLAISRTLVRMMSGNIWAESEVGAGSSFHFTAAFDVTTAVQAERVEQHLVNLPVLIVDDNAVNRRIFADQLTQWRMNATVADSGAAAVAALEDAAARGAAFRLVLLDSQMPEMDGFAVAEYITKRPQLAGSTIMMLTSGGQYGDTERCRELNISAYLTKPIAPKHLLETVCRVLGRTVDTPAVAKLTPVTTQPAARPLNILLAEDNLVNQHVAVGLLKKRGHRTTVANNGQEAVDALARGFFDVVLMDVQMPVMGGLEATAEIRRREKATGTHLRIVAMTAHAMNGDRDRCLSAGMDGYLSKPINPAMLYSVVEDETAPVHADEKPAAAGAAAAPSVDSAELMDRLGGDHQLFTTVIQAFLDDCPTQLATLRAAVEARHPDLVRRTAHTLKGAAGNLSAHRLFAAAQTLERLGEESRVETFEAAWRQLSAEASHVLDALRRSELTRPSSPRQQDVA